MWGNASECESSTQIMKQLVVGDGEIFTRKTWQITFPHVARSRVLFPIHVVLCVIKLDFYEQSTWTNTEKWACIEAEFIYTHASWWVVAKFLVERTHIGDNREIMQSLSFPLQATSTSGHRLATRSSKKNFLNFHLRSREWICHFLSIFYFRLFLSNRHVKWDFESEVRASSSRVIEQRGDKRGLFKLNKHTAGFGENMWYTSSLYVLHDFQSICQDIIYSKKEAPGCYMIKIVATGEVMHSIWAR